MPFRVLAARLPERLATGGFILHSGLQKWGGDAETAAGIHGMAVGAYPFLAKLQPTHFLRLLAATEIATGAALLVPFVPRALAGAALTAFSAGLVGLYLRTPALHEPGSVWPTPAGIGVSKDVFMLGIGASLVLDGVLPGKVR
ncbi:MAG: hypothetical protein JWP61_1888 [Friedmanniella sp.]|nr:hypothetical protein [Friedmanniella sp.]